MSKNFNSLPIRHPSEEVQHALSTGVRRNLTEADVVVRDLLQRTPSLRARLGLPSVEERDRARAEHQLAQIHLDYTVKSLAVLREGQLAALRESLNIFLTVGRAGARADAFAYLSSKWNDLKSALDREFDRLVESAEEQFARADRIKHPATKTIALARIDDLVQAFYEFSKGLVQDFEHIREEKLRTVDEE